MIKSMTVTNNLGESLTIELRSPEKSGFFILDIDPLTPVKSTINTTKVTGRDGETLNSAWTPKRNLLITLGLLENPTIQDSRRLVYKYFPKKKKVRLVFDMEATEVELWGYVESTDAVIFAKQQSVKISLICVDPFFYATTSGLMIYSTIAPAFQFPFSNASLVTNLIQMATLTIQTEKVIANDGDVEVGMLIYAHAIGAVSGLAITNFVTQGQIIINHAKLVALLGTGITTGDDIYISTVKGNKYIKLIRSGTEHNILNTLNENVDWFQLAKGNNIFLYTADSGINNLTFEIQYKIGFEGI